MSVEALDPELQEMSLDFAVFPEEMPIPEAAGQILWTSATVYTDLDSDCEFADLAPLTPQFWGGSEFKVPQN